MNNKLLIYTPSVIDIDLTQGFGNSFQVNDKQPDSIFRAVEIISYYSKYEGRYDFVQYTANEDKGHKNVHAYIWIDQLWDDTVAVGACAFRFLGDIGQIQDWSLQWIWMHPYYRGRGLLSGTWELFVKKYGKDFDVDKPLSRDMKAFLTKMGHKYD